MSKGSNVGPLLFNIFIKDIFFYTRSLFCNFDHDNWLYSIESNIKDVKTNLKKNLELLKEWCGNCLCVFYWSSNFSLFFNPKAFRHIKKYILYEKSVHSGKGVWVLQKNIWQILQKHIKWYVNISFIWIYLPIIK